MGRQLLQIGQGRQARAVVVNGDLDPCVGNGVQVRQGGLRIINDCGLGDFKTDLAFSPGGYGFDRPVDEGLGGVLLLRGSGDREAPGPKPVAALAKPVVPLPMNGSSTDLAPDVSIAVFGRLTGKGAGCSRRSCSMPRRHTSPRPDAE